MNVRARLRLLLVPAVVLGGCRRAPAFNVLGSFFPGWILCIVAGIVVTILIRAVLYRTGVERNLKLLPLVYTSLSVAIACIFWLLFFE